jgi:hypothetical protein
MTFEEHFDRAWPWLEEAAKPYGNTTSREHVYQRLIEGRAQLWVDETAAVVTSIETHDTGLTEVLGWLAGGDIEGVLRLHDKIETWAREAGIDRLLITGRKGFLKKFPGYRVIATTIVKDLR